MHRDAVLAEAHAVRRLMEGLCVPLAERGDHDTFIPWDSDLGSGCAIASAALVSRLSRVGVGGTFVYGLYDGLDHCWVVVGERIIDVTATQFGVVDLVHEALVGDPRYKPLDKGELGLRVVAEWAEQSPAHDSRVMAVLCFSTGARA